MTSPVATFAWRLQVRGAPSANISVNSKQIRRFIEGTHEKEEYKTKFESMSAKEEEEPKEDSPSDKKKEHDAKPEDEKPSAQDEDVEMTNYDTEGDHDAPSGDKAE